MEIKLNDKNYIMPEVKAKMVRKSIEISTKTDFNNLKVTDLDELVDFVVELFKNQFTRDDVYEYLDSTELIPTITEAIQSVVGKMNVSLEKFPKND